MKIGHSLHKVTLLICIDIERTWQIKRSKSCTKICLFFTDSCYRNYNYLQTDASVKRILQLWVRPFCNSRKVQWYSKQRGIKMYRFWWAVYQSLKTLTNSWWQRNNQPLVSRQRWLVKVLFSSIWWSSPKHSHNLTHIYISLSAWLFLGNYWDDLTEILSGSLLWLIRCSKVSIMVFVWCIVRN